NKEPSKEAAGLVLQVAGKSHACPSSEMNDGWHHVAVASEQGVTEATYRVFLDGKKVLSVAVPVAAQGKSPANVYLGRPRSLPKDETAEGELSLAGFRLSSKARYAATFKPSALKPDGHTVAALDFNSAPSDTVADS